MENLIDIILQRAIWPFMIFLFGLAAVFFIWGIVEFIIYSDNEEKRNIGKRHLIWGIIGLLIMFSVYGIYAIIENFIGSIPLQ